MTTPVVTLPLRDLVLGAFSTVIFILETEIGFCADCRETPGGPCPDHRGDSALADEYRAARSRVTARVTGWTVEGVARCPGDCGLYFDFCGSPQDLEKFISEHDCAVAQIGEEFR